jgi:hypothetical protein
MRKPRALVFLTAGAATGVALLLVSIMVANGSAVFWEHYGCVPGTELASQHNWTPDLFWNAPYGGTVFAREYEYGGAQYGWNTNGGEVQVAFEQLQWNLTSVDRVLQSGPGPSQQCPSYEVTWAPNLAPWEQYSGCSGCVLLGSGNVSDSGVPSQFNMSLGLTGPGLTSVIFHDSYVRDNDGAVSTCGRGPTEINLTTTVFDFQIPFVTRNGIVVVDSNAYHFGPTSLFGYGENFTYFFPANFGTWEIDNLTMGPDAPGSGLAFSYSPCSA